MPTLSDADISWRSHWLKQALAAEADLAPPLEDATVADVCIVGGGYLGLWTSILLKEQNPALDVVLIEKDICGGGPSGRNSGMLLSAWTKFSAITALRGEEAALKVVLQTAETIDLIDAHCRAEGIDCWFDRVGWIWGATCDAQNGAWNDALQKLERHGYVPARRVSRDEIAARSGSSGFLAGAFDPSAATIHPGHLVRGLRRSALKRGVRLYEKTPMVRFSRTREPMVETPQGSVQCGKLVLAMNAWSAGVPELAPALFVISSDDAVSLPMPDRLQSAGYAHGPLMIDSRVFVSGWRPTRDGRLVVGVTGGHIGFGGRIDGRFDRASPRVAHMRASLRVGHPALADFPLEGSWNGPIDRTDSGLPLFGALPDCPDVLYGYGFSGNGIGMSHVGARILRSLALGACDDWSEHPLVRPVRRGFPREPVRFVGAHFVRGAVRRRDRLEHAGRTIDPLTTWLAGLAPSGVTPSRANQTPA